MVKLIEVGHEIGGRLGWTVAGAERVVYQVAQHTEVNVITAGSEACLAGVLLPVDQVLGCKDIV